MSMKTWFARGGVLCALVGGLWLWMLHDASVAEPAVARPVTVAEFVRFPVDRTIAVDIDAEPADFGALNPRRQLDQALDWLLLAALSQSAMPEAALNQATFDLPAVRRGYMGAVADLDYGPRRSRIIGQGRVLALIPASQGAERAQHLAAVFDEQRKNLGAVPRELVVFEYQVDLGRQSATLVRRAPVAGAALMSAEYGYVEAEVGTRDDLQRFLAQTSDVVHAALREGHLVLGGRKPGQAGYQGLGLEEVASLWQSERAVGEKRAAFQAKWQAELDKLNEGFHGDAAEYKLAYAALKDRAREDLRTQGNIGGSGFSLDPDFDYPKLAAVVAQNRGALLLFAGVLGDSLTAEDLDKVIAGLRRGESRSFYQLQYALHVAGTPGAASLQKTLEEFGTQHSFQHARYDGTLEGTKVGMTLFYTDLIAKLWALDFHGSASRGVVAGFRPLTQAVTSPVFGAEIRALSATRVWFGHQDKGMQLGPHKASLLFARNATRVYAAGANALVPGKEAEANAESAQFLGWWDDHYEDIAAFEPQYQRLNQIMKWSAIVGWLNAKDEGARLAYLGDVHVAHDNWFPDWAPRQTGLRFSDWKKVGFFKRGDPRSSTEAMPILSSASFESSDGSRESYEGGVSLANEALFAERQALAETAPAAARRSAVDYGRIGVSDTAEIKMLSGVSHAFSSEGGRARLLSRAREGAKLRTADGELANQEIERVLRRTQGGLVFDTAVGGKPASELRIAPARNGLTIALQNHELDQVQLVAVRASRYDDLGEALLADRDVEMVVRLPGDNRFAFKLYGSRRWAEIVPEAEPAPAIASGWDGRAASVEAVQNVQFRLFATMPDLADKNGMTGTAATFVLIKDGDKPLASAIKLDAAALQARSGGEDWWNGLANGNTSGMGARIAADPPRASRELRAALKADLADVDRMLRDDRAVLAAQKLEELRKVHGNVPDIQLRLGLALIERGKTARAAQAVDGMAAAPMRDGDAFFDEIARRIQNQQHPQASSIERWADLAHLHQDLASGRHPRLRVGIEPGDTLGIALHHGDPLKRSARHVDDPAAIEGAEYLLYVQGDLPGMNSVDWNQPLGTALHQLPDGVTATVLKLEDISVAQFHPDVLYAPDVASKMALAPGRKVALRRPGVRPGTVQRCGQTGVNDTLRDCPEEPAPPVYLVMRQG